MTRQDRAAEARAGAAAAQERLAAEGLPPKTLQEARARKPALGAGCVLVVELPRRVCPPGFLLAHAPCVADPVEPRPQYRHRAWLDSDPQTVKRWVGERWRLGHVHVGWDDDEGRKGPVELLTETEEDLLAALAAFPAAEETRR